GGNSISVIETSTNTLSSTISGGFYYPGGIVRDPFSNTFYVANSIADTIHIVNVTDGIIGSIPLTGFPRALAISPDGHTLYASLPYDGRISVIDLTTGTEMTTISVGTYPYFMDLSPNGEKLFVVNVDSEDISVINTTNKSVIQTIPVGSYPQGIKISP